MRSTFPQIQKPTLLVDKNKALANLEKMSMKAAKAGLSYRPHFKTHQSIAVGEWHRAYDIDKIAVSSVDMADYFSGSWQDILIAFPVNIREIERIIRLAKKVTRLGLLVESPFTVNYLSEHLTNEVDIYIKIDTGYHRTGIDYTQQEDVEATLMAIERGDKVRFAGFLVHAGHTYDVEGKSNVEVIHREALDALGSLEQRYRSRFPHMVISYGDTPSASLMDNFAPAAELRPGNLIYYDVMQMYIGACTWDQIAVCMACPIVSLHPERSEIVVYGGGVHFSKDVVERNGKKIFGLPVELTESGWSAPPEGSYVRKLSQEHGVVKVPQSWVETYQPGDLLGVLPIHSCLAVDCISDCYTMVGDRLDLFQP
ncbi:alanine racemase [Roseivirga sp. BDSF3-8]|uniref:alanine racemase n=1 Tax=Roseivirga sp. BDSF3-8 TaxID=3241598 RepID=UPI003531EA6C